MTTLNWYKMSEKPVCNDQFYSIIRFFVFEIQIDK